MRFVFYVFLFFVAISTLIVLAAAVRIAWTRVARPMPMSSDSAAQARSTGIGDGLLLAAIALTWYNTASGWICQRVVYPLYVDLSAVSPAAFHAYSHGYLSRIVFVIILPGGALWAVSALLLWFPCCNVSHLRRWLLVGFCFAALAITPIAASAQGQMHDAGFSAALEARLLWSNWIRAIAFTGAGLVTLSMVRARWSGQSTQLVNFGESKGSNGRRHDA